MENQQLWTHTHTHERQRMIVWRGVNRQETWPQQNDPGKFQLATPAKNRKLADNDDDKVAVRNCTHER